MATTVARKPSAQRVSAEKSRNRRAKPVLVDQDLLFDLTNTFHSVRETLIELERQFLKFQEARKALVEDANARIAEVA